MADDHNHVYNDDGNGRYVCWCGAVLGSRAICHVAERNDHEGE